MSAFKLEYKDYEFTILLEPDPMHAPIERWHVMTDEDKELLASGELAYFSLTITSKKGDESVIHLIPGVQLPADEEEQMEDIEMILLDDGLLDEILDHWKLRLREEITPPWA